MNAADVATLAAGLPALVILYRRRRSIRRRTAAAIANHQQARRDYADAMREARAEYRAARRAAAVEHREERAARRYRATMRILAGKGWDRPTLAPSPDDAYCPECGRYFDLRDAADRIAADSHNRAECDAWGTV